MRVPNEKIALLENVTVLPADWLREWAAGASLRSIRPVMLLNKVNLAAPPARTQGLRASARHAF